MGACQLTAAESQTPGAVGRRSLCRLPGHMVGPRRSVWDASGSLRMEIPGVEAYRTTKRVRKPEGQGLNDLHVRFFRMAERRIAEKTGKAWSASSPTILGSAACPSPGCGSVTSKRSTRFGSTTSMVTTSFRSTPLIGLIQGLRGIEVLSHESSPNDLEHVGVAQEGSPANRVRLASTGFNGLELFDLQVARRILPPELHSYHREDLARGFRLPGVQAVSPRHPRQSQSVTTNGAIDPNARHDSFETDEHAHHVLRRS